MADIIYYVGLRVSQKSEQALCKFYNLPPKRLHSTIIYSRTWFPFKESDKTIVITPPYKTKIFSGLTVVCYSNNDILLRYAEFLSTGGSSDYPSFHPHISIGGPFLDAVPNFDITFDGEYYRTWKEEI